MAEPPNVTIERGRVRSMCDPTFNHEYVRSLSKTIRSHGQEERYQVVSYPHALSRKQERGPLVRNTELAAELAHLSEPSPSGAYSSSSRPGRRWSFGLHAHQEGHACPTDLRRH
mmetsp:Transcript_40078/g.120817  ORF Transcript_40078/g.120817 Transcript_40078/m.120817 type:complete len:114 (+) Transcript_40078:827-1168(+)